MKYFGIILFDIWPVIIIAIFEGITNPFTIMMGVFAAGSILSIIWAVNNNDKMKGQKSLSPLS